MECPDSIVSGNLKVKVKDGSNPWWAAYQVTNAKNPINGMSLSVDGGTTWLEMVGPEEPAPSGFWFMKPSDLILNNEMENYKIRVESDTGDIVVNMVGVVASSETDSGTNNGGGVDCGGQGGLGSEGPATEGPPGTPEGTAGVTEGTEEATEEVSSTTSPVSEGGVGSCDDLIVDKSGWTGTWQGKLKILLAADVSQYSISFRTDLPVSSLNFWEGQLTGSGNSFTLQSPSYFSGKTAGEYLEHGFQLSYSGSTEPSFSSITFNGVDICQGGNAGGATEGPGVATTTQGSGGETAGPVPSTTCAGTICGTSSSEPITTEIQDLRDSTSCTLDNALVEDILPGAPNNPVNVKNVEQVIPEAKFNEFFPTKNGAYTYTNFLRAIGKYPSICKSAENCPKILAGMFAHFQQETAGLFYLEEINKSAYCADWSAWVSAAYPCVPGQLYYGRGAKQLSWNYNYGAFSQAMFGDARILLEQPDLVANTWLNFASSMWFYVTPQPPKPSMLQVVEGDWTPNSVDEAANLAGFGATTMIINGALECGPSPSNPTGASNRANYYTDFAARLGVDITGEKLTCSDSSAFPDAGSAGSLTLFWDPDNGCSLVKWQTAYSALVEGNYAACNGEQADCSGLATSGGGNPSPPPPSVATVEPGQCLVTGGICD